MNNLDESIKYFEKAMFIGSSPKFDQKIINDIRTALSEVRLKKFQIEREILVINLIEIE